MLRVMASRAIDDLFAQTLNGDYQDDAPWEAVSALRGIGTREVFEKAAEWCKSDKALVRSRGADVLAQLGVKVEHPDNSFPAESHSVIADLVQRETDPQPLSSAIAALGHLNNPAAIPQIVNHASHPSKKMWFSFAQIQPPIPLSCESPEIGCRRLFSRPGIGARGTISILKSTNLPTRYQDLRNRKQPTRNIGANETELKALQQHNTKFIFRRLTFLPPAGNEIPARPPRQVSATNYLFLPIKRDRKAKS
jgi:hypothetical protein